MRDWLNPVENGGNSNGGCAVRSGKNESSEAQSSSGKTSLLGNGGSAGSKSRIESASKEPNKRVVVVHCKAGKGRSGTASCSYLISEEGWTKEAAVNRFTERRMRPGWNQIGVSIPSQLRWLEYVERWKNGGKVYVERKVEVKEVHVWGLKNGVEVSVRGFIEEGKVIKVWHTFKADEREVVRGKVGNFGFSDAVLDLIESSKTPSASNSKTGTPKNRSLERLEDKTATASNSNSTTSSMPTKADAVTSTSTTTVTSTAPVAVAGSANVGADAVFRPKKPIILDSNDINIDTERRTKGAYTWGVTTSISHVWFNTFFEGNGPENNGNAVSSGVFEIEWDKMDGIKGSSQRGTKGFDKLQVVWKVADGDEGHVVREPIPGEKIQQAEPADWKGVKDKVEPDKAAVEPETSDEEDQGTQSHVGEMAK